eukprot:m.1119376 g.1119376  ORF g.1119376 m.1119376 type:complete len:418 (+) comp24390_c0_seq3:327-1580(+)
MPTRCSLRWWAGMIPVTIVHILLAWTMYVFDVLVLGHTLDIHNHKFQAVIYIVVYHSLVVMLLASYWRAILATPRKVPREFAITDEEYCSLVDGNVPESVARRKLPVLSRSSTGKVNVCRTCMIVKPDRTHHCSICRQCVLKMDHHCPWVNNCVGHHNYKYFCTFLFYALTFLVAFICLMVPFVVQYLRSNHHSKRNYPSQRETQEIDLMIPLCTLIAGIFLFAVMPLACMHAQLLSSNETTLESMRTATISADVKNWSLRSSWKNASVVCGHRVLCWLCPRKTWTDNGVEYEVVLHDGQHTSNHGGLATVVSCNSGDAETTRESASECDHASADNRDGDGGRSSNVNSGRVGNDSAAEIADGVHAQVHKAQLKMKNAIDLAARVPVADPPLVREDACLSDDLNTDDSVTAKLLPDQ